MTVQYMNEAKKSIRTMDRGNRERVGSALKHLPNGDILPMYYEDTYRLRVGKWRVIFSYNPDRSGVVIHRVASRGDIYKGINC